MRTLLRRLDRPSPWSRGIGRILLLGFLTTVLGGGFLLSAGGPASAKADGPLTEVVNGNEPTKTSGTNNDFAQLTAPAACDASATRHVTKIVAVTAARASDQKAADAWVGDNLYATSSVGLPGPLTVQGSISWQGMADAYGQSLVPGTYRFILRCQDNLGTVIFEQWRGGVTFSSPKAWVGFTGASSNTGKTSDATGTATASPKAPTTATPSGSATAGPGDASTAPSTASDNPSESDAASGAKGTGAGNGLAATGASVAGVSLIGLALLGLGAALFASSRRRRNHSVDSTRR